MATNVTTAVFGESCNTATASPSLVQWDKGQVLQISGLDLPDAYQVEFSTVYTRNAIPRVGDASGVEVPNELLQRSAPITAYIKIVPGRHYSRLANKCYGNTDRWASSKRVYLPDLR